MSLKKLRLIGASFGKIEPEDRLVLLALIGRLAAHEMCELSGNRQSQSCR